YAIYRDRDRNIWVSTMDMTCWLN
ncbi:two-component regulator propeller domain-containing protein, partial [uncultured Muribaculum sp.]